MVSSATSLTRNGIADYLIQRITAVVLAVYTVIIVGFLLLNPDLGYEQWAAFLGGTVMRYLNTFVVLAIAGHAWIGMWTIGTDYLREAHVGSRATLIRGLYMVLCAGAIFVYVAWALELFWGI